MEITEKVLLKSSQRNLKKKAPPSLFPHQIRNRNNFYLRDHPEKLNPETPVYQKYWSEQLKYIIEGRWINDEGRWVYMMPKLYFFINYARIYDEDRHVIYPRLRDIEWIIFTYFMGIDGFSGFEGDEEFTCNYLIKQLEEDKDSLTARQYARIPASCRRKDGFKKYVDPWYYLTRHYLIDNPPDIPLGKALYENPRKNGIILGCRGVAKSYATFVGDFGHEFLTNGIKDMSDIKHMSSQVNFAMGSGDGRQLDRSIANVKAFYDNMPGKYEYEDGVFMGPFYKRTQGSWRTGFQFQHLVKHKGGSADKIKGNLVQMVALTSDRTKVGAGDRFRRIYIEEIGFQKNLLDVFRANINSMKVGGKKVGSLIGLGTGGDLKAIQEPKAVFENVDAYDVFGIPNYWKNPKKKIGLFIPAYYADEDYKDNQGNTDIEDAYNAVVTRREKLRKEIDPISFESEIMYNPLVPEEILRPSEGSILPKQSASKQLDNLESFDLFRNRAQIGDLKYNQLETRGVEFVKDMTGSKKPILKWEAVEMVNKAEGAVIIYEQPPQFIPDGLYYVVYDPVQKSGDGTSYNSILVYKNFYRGKEDSLQDTIVAEWIGRKERIEDNYHMVIKFARYFGATIFPEINVPGFVDWCRMNNYYSLLESDGTYFLQQEVNPKIGRNYYKIGFKMGQREKRWALRKLRDWLLEYKKWDPITGLPIQRTIDTIFSPRVLDEIVAFTDDKDYNFDHISSLLGLMILIGKLGKEPVDLIEEEENKIPSDIQKYIDQARQQQMQILNTKPKRSRFLNY